MRRTRLSPGVLTALALGLAVAGCGKGGSVTGADGGGPVPVPVGHAVIAGTVVGGGVASSSWSGVHALSGSEGLVVTVEGTGLQAPVDEEGEFALAGVPAGTVTLHFQGPGVDARLTVSGLVDGQVLTLKVHVSGSSAQTTSTPTCAPTSDVKFTGILEQISSTELIVSGRRVDLGALQKVWRNGRRTTLDSLEVGEKVKVWGTLRGDGVVVAEEIEAQTEDASTGDKRVSFRGRVDSVDLQIFDVQTLCTPVLVVKGVKVKTNESTKFRWSDGTGLDPTQIQVGDQASVDGWAKPGGYVLAAKVVIARR